MSRNVEHQVSGVLQHESNPVTSRTHRSTSETSTPRDVRPEVRAVTMFVRRF